MPETVPLTNYIRGVEVISTGMSQLPDEDFYPAATGRAAETVTQHQDEQNLVFWSGWVRGLHPRARQKLTANI